MEQGRYELRILPLFERDLNEIVDYIAVHLQSPQAAEAFVEEVERAIQTRLPSAEAFAPYPSAKKRKHSYYGIRVKHYIVFYVVIDHVMEVRRVLYQRRNLEKEL